MAESLEVFLQRECENSGLDLHLRLQRVKESAKAIWSVQRLSWFTDHTVRHSERIIDILGQMIAHLQQVDERLSSHELFILLAACYLHDIGMQDFVIDGRGADTFTIADYDLIRKRHPQRGKELIISRSLRRERDQYHIDLDDDPSYLVPIALVAQGHGSEFFEESIAELERLDFRPAGQEIRGGLLTSLLMIGDELDLRRERARFAKELDYSPISALHHHVHSYVNHIEVQQGDTKTQRRVFLSLQFPADTSIDYRLVSTWLIRKLTRQLNRTADIIERSTNGQLRWCLPLDVRETIMDLGMGLGEGVLRTLPKEAAGVLRRDILKVATVNYHQARALLEQHVIRGQEHSVLCLEAEDEQAFVQVINWLEHQVEMSEQSLLIFDFKNEPYERADVIHELCHRFGVTPSGGGRRSWRRQLDEFLAAVSSSERRPAILLFQNLDAATSATVEWIGKHLVPALAQHRIPRSIVLAFQQRPAAFADVIGSWPLVVLGSIDAADIAQHLQQVYGYSAAAAREKASEIHGTSGGRPHGVIFALAHLHLKEVRWQS